MCHKISKRGRSPGLPWLMWREIMAGPCRRRGQAGCPWIDFSLPGTIARITTNEVLPSSGSKSELVI